ncbi:hypothetical protein [Paremcibacter congregatus]|uniref:hypothetical protein n=1 Tax=Paremcibacter congregatus TaxID=2043170 RepID=UPI0030EE54B4|tara:strand:+ start:4783 stop:5481 length:699 start_codon:yes stop_codon:yes gene_type:complete
MTRQENQGNFKALFVKLSGAALGLAVMMSGAVYLGPVILSHETSISSSEAASEAFSSAEAMSYDEMEIAVSLGEDFRTIVEAQQGRAEFALEQARQSLENLRSERLEAVQYMNKEKIAALNEAIREIISEEGVPAAIKENIIADLEQQIENLNVKVHRIDRQVNMTQEQLSLLEDHVVTFAYKSGQLPRSTYQNTSKCSEEEIVIDKCDGDCDEEAPRRRDGKGIREAFYWI